MFHVPEKYRILDGALPSTAADGNNGAFALPAQIGNRQLLVIASDGAGWEHVSVRCFETGTRTRTPTWDEMCYVKNLFWDDEDVVMQLHPRQCEYVDLHPNVLHLWRPIGVKVLTPPVVLV